MSEPISELDKEKRFIELYKKYKPRHSEMLRPGIQPVAEILGDEFLEYVQLRNYFSKEKVEELIERARF